MRRTLRLFASVKPARYLQAGSPTGLTGIYTHPSPRGALLFLYLSTLDKLKAVPEHSLYRQSVEALTKHRLAIVEGTVPVGFEEWAAQSRARLAEQFEESQRLQANVKASAEAQVKAASEQSNVDSDAAFRARIDAVQQDPDAVWKARVAEIRAQLESLDDGVDDSKILLRDSSSRSVAIHAERGGKAFVINNLAKTVDEREEEPETLQYQALQIARERKALRVMYQRMLEAALQKKDLSQAELRKGLESKEADLAPQWTADQVSEVETKIGAGLIEEVVQVAEAELKLVDTMVQAKVWEPLDEQPAEGQWVYFERKLGN